MMPQLLLRGPSGRSIELKDQLVAGRNPECDIVLEQGHPSRRHAQLTIKDGSVWLEDLGSSNGTFVNERRITAPVELKPGDRIRFDVEQWELVSSAGVDEPKTVLRPASPVGPRDVTARPNDSMQARPGAWADPDAKGGAGTRLIDPGELKKMLAESTKAAGAPALADVAGAYLQVKSGQRTGQILKLLTRSGESVWTVGSDPSRDILIPDDGVSGYHADLRNSDGRWKLTDQMSANGTFVDGVKASVLFLSAGDHVVRFGPVECDLHLPRSGARDTGGRSRGRAWIIAAASFVVTAIVLAAAWWAMNGN